MVRFIRISLAARITSPAAALCAVKNAKAKSSAKERIMMSRLTAIMRRNAARSNDAGDASGVPPVD